MLPLIRCSATSGRDNGTKDHKQLFVAGYLFTMYEDVAQRAEWPMVRQERTHRTFGEKEEGTLGRRETGRH